MNNRVLPQRPNRLFLLKSWWKLFILAGGWAWRTMVVMGAPNFRGLFLLASSCWGPSLARKPWESRPTRYLLPWDGCVRIIGILIHCHIYPYIWGSQPTCFFPKAPWRPFWLPRSLFVGPRVGRGGAPLEQVWASETLLPWKPNDSLLVSLQGIWPGWCIWILEPWATESGDWEFVPWATVGGLKRWIVESFGVSDLPFKGGKRPGHWDGEDNDDMSFLPHPFLTMMEFPISVCLYLFKYDNVPVVVGDGM